MGGPAPSMTDGGTPSKMFRTAEFDFGEFPSSDGLMPSSPPAWFGVYEDHEGEGGEANGWNLEFGSSPARDGEKKGADGMDGAGSTEAVAEAGAGVGVAAVAA